MLRSTVRLSAANLNKNITRNCSANFRSALPLLDTKKSPLTQESMIKAKPIQSQRIVRQEAALVRLGFIPEEWFTFFYNKTGVTGFGILSTTLSTFLVSKEFYVLEAEFYNGISMAILCVLAVKNIGPRLAAYLDKEIDAYEESLNQSRNHDKQVLTEIIHNDKKLQWSSEGQFTLVKAKRENVDLQLEEEYRARLMHCYMETKRRLDYCVEHETIHRDLLRKHMAQWVEEEVRTSITPEIEQTVFDNCIGDLVFISKKYQEPEIAIIASKP